MDASLANGPRQDNQDILADRVLAVTFSVAVGASREYYCALSIYAPSVQQKAVMVRTQFFDALSIAIPAYARKVQHDLAHIPSTAPIRFLLGGDFNVPRSPDDCTLRTAGSANRTDRVALSQLVDSLEVAESPLFRKYDIKDHWTHGHDLNIRVVDADGRSTPVTISRIDMVFVSKALVATIQTTNTISIDSIAATGYFAGHSSIDHAPVTLVLKQCGGLRIGPGRFQTNVSHLQHQSLCDRLLAAWRLHQFFRPPPLTREFLLWWDSGKAIIAATLSRHAKKVAQKCRTAESKRGDANRGVHVESTDINDQSIPPSIPSIASLRSVAGTNIRNGWHFPVDDVYDKDFFALGKKRSAESLMHSAVYYNHAGIKITVGSDEPQRIVGAAHRYYRQLYREPKSKEDSRVNLATMALPFLRAHADEIAQRPLPELIADPAADYLSTGIRRDTDPFGPLPDRLLRDCVLVIPSHAACGDDGISHMVYLTMWEVIRQDFIDWILTGMTVGTFGSSNNVSILRIFYKNSGIKSSFDNWRALSMINSDLKIVGHILRCLLRPREWNLLFIPVKLVSCAIDTLVKMSIYSKV